MISFKLNENLFIRDPLTSELGERMISKSIQLIDKMGFEAFTFKKLAEEIDSTEASVYRYFENKHRLLVYLIDWYWTWIGFRIDFKTSNIQDPRARLRVCLRVLTEESEPDPGFPSFDEAALQRIVVSEFEKTYLTKNVDDDNREGLFLPYKSICTKVASVVTEINASYPFARTLVSTLLLSITHQLYYAQHLPSLTEIKFSPKRHRRKLYDFVEDIVFKTIEN